MERAALKVITVILTGKRGRGSLDRYKNDFFFKIRIYTHVGLYVYSTDGFLTNINEEVKENYESCSFRPDHPCVGINESTISF